ncbi:MAG: peptide ABC transporter substrate-binding protein [Chloroflexota bacterium]
MKRQISITLVIVVLAGLFLALPVGRVFSQSSEHNFVDSEFGVRLSYPKGWQKQDGTSATEVAWFISPNGTVSSVLIASPLEGGTFEEYAGLLGESLKVFFTDDVEVSRDEALDITSGQEAWITVMSGTRSSDQSPLKLSLVTAVRGLRTFTLMTFGDPKSYDLYEDEIMAMGISLQIDAPAVQGVPSDQALVLAGGESTNPRSYDPATTHTAGDKLVFSGLVSLDPQLNLVPELAETWEVSSDGTVYTFHIRENAKFHNGRPVTAQDVVYSWERAADPKVGSDTVLTYLGDIVGVREMAEGQADHISGLEILDDHTLRVTIDAAKPYFLLKLTYPTGFVLDQANVESGDEWFREPNGTGPYKLVEWKRFESIVYEANPDFYLGEPQIPAVVVQLYSGVGIRLYEAGDIDIAGVPAYTLDRFLDPSEPMHDELVSGVDLCTSYVVFDVTQPPFDDVKVRQAFSMAFDRQKYIDVVLHGVALPAKGIYPPALPGFSLDLEGLPFDPGQARQLLADSKYGGPDGLPPLVYTNGGLGSYVDPGTAALIAMWEQYLGVTITVENIEPNIYIEELYAGHHGQMFATGWCADYPDPENFADVLFHTGSEQNNGGYSNPELDAILEQARVEQDVTKRIALYQQAEQIIVQDAPVLFTVHGLSYVLVKPYVKGYVLTPIDIPLERYMWIEGK